MKSNAWRNFFDQQRGEHRKVLFTITELANVAGASRAALNVELRGSAQGILVRYAHGLYGPPQAVTPEMLVPAIDWRAYITGHYALFVRNLVTQVPAAIVCFTDSCSPRRGSATRRSGGWSWSASAVGFIAGPRPAAIASPAQALCDYIYLSRRRGTAPEALVTFRNLAGICDEHFAEVVGRYPKTVRGQALDLVGR